jgi:hypothetical protein
MSKLMPAEALEQQPKETMVNALQLLAIKHGLEVRKHGMYVTSGATGKYLLTMLSQYTGVKYKQSDIDKGIEHCDILRKAIHEAQYKGLQVIDMPVLN